MGIFDRFNRWRAKRQLANSEEAVAFGVLNVTRQDITRLKELDVEYKKEFEHDELKLRLDKSVLLRIGRIEQEFQLLMPKIVYLEKLYDAVRKGSKGDQRRTRQLIQAELKETAVVRAAVQRLKNEIAYVRELVYRGRNLAVIEAKSENSINNWLRNIEGSIMRIQKVFKFEVKAELRSLKV